MFEKYSIHYIIYIYIIKILIISRNHRIIMKTNVFRVNIQQDIPHVQHTLLEQINWSSYVIVNKLSVTLGRNYSEEQTVKY